MRLLATGLLIIILFFNSFGQEANDAILAEAEQSIKSGKYDVALVRVDDVLRDDPSNLKAVKMKINIKIYQNNLKEALTLVEDAIDKVSGDDDLIYQRGIINLNLKKYEKAISDFNILIQRNTYSSIYKVYLNRGVANHYLLEYELAATDYTESIKLNPDNAVAYHRRGMLNYEIKDYATAIDDFKKSLEIKGSNPETHYNIGMSFYRLGEVAKGCPHFHQACKDGNIDACKMVMMECTKELPK